MDADLPDSPARQYALVARAIAYLRANAARQPTLAELAQAVHLSEFHLQRVFSQWAGISPKRFLQYLTKEYACQALREAQDVLSVAQASGLSGPGRLHDLMVSCEAMTPGEIRRGGAGVVLGCGQGDTPFGEALLAWTPRGVCYLAFLDGDAAQRYQELRAAWPAAQLQAYEGEAQRLLQWDAEALGFARAEVLGALARRAGSACHANAGAVALVRAGRVAHQLGPLLAQDGAAAARLLEAVSASVAAPLVADVPDERPAMDEALRRLGFKEERRFARMALLAPGQRAPTGRQAWMHAIAGPEFA